MRTKPKEGDRIKVTGPLPHMPTVAVGATGTVVKVLNEHASRSQLIVELDDDEKTTLLLLSFDPYEVTW